MLSTLFNFALNELEWAFAGAFAGLLFPILASIMDGPSNNGAWSFLPIFTVPAGAILSALIGFAFQLLVEDKGTRVVAALSINVGLAVLLAVGATLPSKMARKSN